MTVSKEEFVRRYSQTIREGNAAVFAGAGLFAASSRDPRLRTIDRLVYAMITRSMPSRAFRIFASYKTAHDCSTTNKLYAGKGLLAASIATTISDESQKSILYSWPQLGMRMLVSGKPPDAWNCTLDEELNASYVKVVWGVVVAHEHSLRVSYHTHDPEPITAFLRYRDYKVAA